MDGFFENIKNPDQQIQAQTLENISEVLSEYVETDKIFSYTTEEQINSFFKTDLFRFTNLLVNNFPQDYNELTIQEGLFLLMESYLSILNKNVFSICLPFSTLILGLKKLPNFEDSFFTNILSIDLLMNLTESFDNEPNIELLDFMLIISSCIDSEESQIDNKVMFGEISEAIISLFSEVNFNKCDSIVISRIFTSLTKMITDFANSESGSDAEIIDDLFNSCFFNSLIKVLQCESFEKQNFAINCLEKMLNDNMILFFKWASKVNPFITLNNIEGIDQIVIEISHLIQKIAGLHIIEIDQETLEKMIARIDHVDLSQRKTFNNNFGVVASNSDEEIVLKVIKNYIESHKLTPNLCSFLGSCAVFTLNTQPTVSQYIISFLEGNITDFFNSNETNDNSVISVLEKIYKLSPSDHARMKILCTSYFSNNEQKVPEHIYILMLSIFNNLEPVEASQFLDKLIQYDDKDEPLFDKLLAHIVLNCEIPLKSNQSIYILTRLTENEKRLETLFEIMKKRGTNIISLSNWINEIPKIIKTAPIKIALKFTNKVIPNFYYLSYQTYYNFFLNVEILFMIRYVREEDDKTREEIFECFYTILIMYNLVIRSYFLMSYFEYFQKIFGKFEYKYLIRLANLFLKTLIRSEYYIDDNYYGIKRHRKIKKEKGGFDLSITHIKPGHFIHAYPKTLVKDLLYAIGLFDNTSNLTDLSLRKVSDQTILDNDTTLEDNNVNETTEIETIINTPHHYITPNPYIFTILIKNEYNIGVQFIMDILFNDSISAQMLEIHEDFHRFLKSIWKIIKILTTPDDVKIYLKDSEFLFNVLFRSKNPFKRLYYIQEIANQSKKDKSYLTFLHTTKLLEKIAKMIFDEKLAENLRVEVLQILIHYSRNDNNLSYFDSNDLNRVVPILINNFINAKKLKIRKLILELLNLIFSLCNDDTFRQINSLMLIDNSEFFDLCIFTKESLIVHSLKLISTLSENASINTLLFKKFVSYFDQIISSNSSGNDDDDDDGILTSIQTEDYFQLFGAILTSTGSECSDEVDTVFIKCVSKLKDYNYKWFNNVAELVSIFVSKMNKQLDEQSVVDLINFIFNGYENIEHSFAFSILRHIFVYSDDPNKPLYSFFVQSYVEKFKTDRWNYSPSIHKKRDKYCGLRNLGSTCYMNSILQLLENNSSFFNRIFSIENPTPIVVQIRELFAHLECSDVNYANTEQFANHWKEHEYPPFEPRVQEDAAEFLNIFLDKLPEEVKEPFTGKLIHSFDGINVDFHRDVQDMFYTLEIPILPDFFESMRSIIKPQMFIGNNQYTSEEKGKIDVERTCKIVQFPRTLVIQLKRFDYSVKEGKRTKINDEFIFPMSFNTKKCFPDIDESQTFDYVLTGVITHTGTAEGGHYNSIYRKIKMNDKLESESDDDDDEWICFNDSEVSRITKEKFWSMAKGDSYSQISAYLLFYEWNDATFKEQLSEDKKALIDDKLKEKIINENREMQQVQSLFTDPMARFIINLSTPSILIKYYTQILCHSSLTSAVKSYTNEIIKQAKDDSNSVAEYLDEECTEIFDALVNATDEMATSIIDVLSFMYKIDANKDKSFDINKLNSISSGIINHLKNFVHLWRVYERFGKIVEVICSSHLEIALKYDYFDSIVSLISEFYNVTTGNVAIENINLTPFINGLNILIKSINSQESLNKLIQVIDFYGEKIGEHQASFSTLVKTGISQNKLPNKFMTFSDEKVTKDNIIDFFIKCETNRDFISFLPSIKSVTSVNDFFEKGLERNKYLFGDYMQKIPVFNIFLIFYAPFVEQNKVQAYNWLAHKIKMEMNKDPYYFSTSHNKPIQSQLGSEIQEGISTMINLFGYSFITYPTTPHIMQYFNFIFEYSLCINTPKNEHLVWFIPLFDELCQRGKLIIALDLVRVILSYANVDTNINFFEKRIDLFSVQVFNNYQLQFYFDFASGTYKCFSEAMQKRPDLFMKLIQPGPNLNSFLYLIKNAKNDNEFKNKDTLLESLKDIIPACIAFSNDFALKILELFKIIIDIVFNESRLFFIVDKLVDVMDDQSAILFIEKLLVYSSEIVKKMRVVSTLNVMTKIAQKISDDNNDAIRLIELAPRYIRFFNANKDQIPIVIEFATILAEKCHPLGDALFDTMIDISNDNTLTLSKWELLAVALGLCYDRSRAEIIANKILQSSTEGRIDEFLNNKGVVDCICKLSEFATEYDTWSEKIAHLMCNIHSMPTEYEVFIKSIINKMPNDKLEQFAEACINRMRSRADIELFIQNVRILLMIKSNINFDMNAFVEKHKDIFINEWPMEVEKDRSLFINI